MSAYAIVERGSNLILRIADNFVSSNEATYTVKLKPYSKTRYLVLKQLAEEKEDDKEAKISIFSLVSDAVVVPAPSSFSPSEKVKRKAVISEAPSSVEADKSKEKVEEEQKNNRRKALKSFHWMFKNMDRSGK